MLRRAALTPIPRANLLRYHGVFAPNAKHRKSAVGRAERPERAPTCPPSRDRSDRIDWASLLRHVDQIDVFSCLSCGGKARPISVIEDRDVVKKILAHLGLRQDPLPLVPMRRPAQHALNLVPRDDEPLEPSDRELPRIDARRGRRGRTAAGVDA